MFHELDVPVTRTYDPKIIALVRSAEEFKKTGASPLKDGTLPVFRWAPTPKGLALTIRECASCHSDMMPDGSILDGAPLNFPPTLAALFVAMFLLSV